MKKALFIAASFGLLMFAACEPEQLSTDNNALTYESSAIEKAFSFVQYEDKDYTIQNAEGNYFFYQTNPAMEVQIITVDKKGVEKIIGHGASGKFNISPSRGSDPVQSFIVRTINPDMKYVDATLTATVTVASELSDQMFLFVGNAGSKTWKWDTSITGAVWGNMGYCGGKGSDVGTAGNGQWWGISTEEEFGNQLQHTPDGQKHGDESWDATMVFSETGEVKCFDKNGTEFRSGSFEIQNWAPDAEAWRQGMLHTDAGSILWPYEINAGGNMPTDFEIVYITPDKLCLVYPDGGNFDALGGWGEASFWHFAADVEALDYLAGNGSKGWTWNWDAPGGAVWGNMGYCGGAGSEVALNGNGKWWGITEESQFAGQLQHTPDGQLHGDESVNAYMTFAANGVIQKFDGDGNQIGNDGSFEFEPVEGNEWKLGDLKTSAGAILWPYEINSGGNMPTQFELVYATDERMVLVYPDGGNFSALGGWGEATFWQFKKN